MGSKLSAADQGRVEALAEGKKKWDRIRSLVEKAVSEERGRDTLLLQCHRNASALARFFANNALGPLAQIANDLAFAVKRSGRLESRIGTIREAVGRGYAGIDQAQSALRRKASKS